MTEPAAQTWAIVELMGHVRLAGRVTEEEKFGGKLGRIDIPSGDEFITQYFGASSVYRITVVTEEVARHVSKQTAPAPVSPWDFPKALSSAGNQGLMADRDDDDCDSGIDSDMEF